MANRNKPLNKRKELPNRKEVIQELARAYIALDGQVRVLTHFLFTKVGLTQEIWNVCAKEVEDALANQIGLEQGDPKEEVTFASPHASSEPTLLSEENKTEVELESISSEQAVLPTLLEISGTTVTPTSSSISPGFEVQVSRSMAEGLLAPKEKEEELEEKEAILPPKFQEEAFELSAELIHYYCCTVCGGYIGDKLTRLRNGEGSLLQGACSDCSQVTRFEDFTLVEPKLVPKWEMK